MSKLRIQFVSANAVPSAPLRIDVEKREIQNRLGNGAVVFDSPAARLGDVITALRKNNPSIVHFSAHGSPVKEIVLLGDQDRSTPVPRAAILDLFRKLRGNIRLVVFNACFSAELAEEIKEHIECVIGVSENIPDDSAVRYGVQLYDALASGKSIQEAHGEGEILMLNDRLPPERRPALIHRRDVDPARIFLRDSRKTSNQQVKDRDIPRGVQHSEAATLASVSTRLDHVPAPSEVGTISSDRGEPTERERVRVFISYKREIAPDQQLAMELFENLSKQYDVFIDLKMPIGTLWAKRIEEELRRADYIVVLLSKVSVQSEMLVGEVEAAYKLSAERKGRPVILPVRVKYRDSFQYPLNCWLNKLNWGLWTGPEDTAGLIANLIDAFRGGEGESQDQGANDQSLVPSTDESDGMRRPLPAAQPPVLATPGGTMNVSDEFYLYRSSDELALRAIRGRSATISIKGARQMGKSSLLMRVMNAAEGEGKRVAFLDFQLLDASALMSAEVFFRQFSSWITDALELVDKVADYWSLPFGQALRCTRYVSRHLLPQVNQPLVLALDEVDRVMHAPFRTDFFGMLRSWHNGRATEMIWTKLDLVLVISTEPHLLIDSAQSNQSPFNVGEIISAHDFTKKETAELNRLHGDPLNPDELTKLYDLLAGHPYLVRKALYVIRTNQLSASDLFARATLDNGPFGDHLRYYFLLLNDKQDLVDGLQQIIRTGQCKDDALLYRLKSAGLADGEPMSARLRCSLYTTYFRERLGFA